MIKDNINVCFTYRDELGNTISVDSDVSSDYIYEDELDTINYLYIRFLLACGFNCVQNKRVEFVEE